MSAPSAATPQRVCPRCATVAFTAAARCPYCGGSYRRRPLGAVAAMLAVTAAVVLGGVYLMLVQFGDTLDSELDDQVETVQRDFDRQLRGLQREIREELDRRFPATGTTTP
ncbi:MAG TPA: hypothetical protein VF533_07675 [Solirubrobacteraceae bacterium]|jgi:hypothetical protein